MQKELGDTVNYFFEEKKAEELGKGEMAILGPKGSFSEEAAIFYGQRIEDLTYTDTILDVISLVKQKKVAIGLVPVENSIGGTVTQALDNIYLERLQIIKAIVIPIHHCYAGLEELKTVEEVYSHPQGLSQCDGFIKKYFPRAKLTATASTSGAFKMIKEEGLTNAIAIGPENSAETYNLKIMKRNIEDKKNNKTKFFVISTESSKEPGEITSLVIKPKRDKVGLLYDIVEPFKTEKINLTKLESRPRGDDLGQYIFYIDAATDQQELKAKKILEDIRKNIGEATVLGSYNVLEKKDKKN